MDLGRAYQMHGPTGRLLHERREHLCRRQWVGCGQVHVIACSILAMAAIRAAKWSVRELHFICCFLPPFIATTLALCGATGTPLLFLSEIRFTNYAGMALAVVAILGHFSRHAFTVDGAAVDQFSRLHPAVI